MKVEPFKFREADRSKFREMLKEHEHDTGYSDIDELREGFIDRVETFLSEGLETVTEEVDEHN